MSNGNDQVIVSLEDIDENSSRCEQKYLQTMTRLLIMYSKQRGIENKRKKNVLKFQWGQILLI